jgi:hypothetical protein
MEFAKGKLQCQNPPWKADFGTLTGLFFLRIMDNVKTIYAVVLVSLFVFFWGAGTAAAEEAVIPFRFSIGLGAEGNKNTKENIAIAGVLTNDFSLNARLSIGSRLGFSYNFDDLGTLEAGILFRVYFLSKNSSGPFIQADGGLSYIFRRNDIHDDMCTEFLYGGTLGWRFRIKSFYFEPYGRGGYPFIWGGGLVMGVSL